ncbi:EF-hand domain-containing protein [Sphingomonas abietis]|uniref:EF-hand domain-containing protein n=1 Tax=Sphingomonas abietis TaxID=3012344 RepID=A0ABY7NIW2_9SPHN|nr:hypothetical protein [Sphingomonas abietis]WBO20930.1 hypothetical protein PBT88_11990 [Sphingomonas abietis]
MSILLGALLVAGAAAAAPPRSPPAPEAAVAQSAASPPVAAPRPTRDQVLAAVRSEWSTYDQGDKGRLTPLEFSTWVMRSHGGSVEQRGRAKGASAKGIAPVSAMNASSTAFARADANHDGGVTPDEMTRFLMTPPTPTALSRARAGVAKPAPAKPLEALVVH